jgi:myo-inositol-1(or 4)-monophosphatase
LTWELLTVATDAVLRAGAIQRQRYGTDVEIEHKGSIDLVTEVDKACEATIVDAIRSRYPAHDIVAEESHFERRGSEYVWFVDPLDGTTNFAHGYPCFAASVAVARRGEVVAGAVYDAMREDLFTGERGAGAWHNGHRLRVSSASRLIDSLLITGFPYDIHTDTPTKLRRFVHIMGCARAIRRDGAAAIDLCYVAAGRADGFWEDALKPWDMLAGALMIEEAGGRVTRYDGSPLGLGPDEIAATNGALHGDLLQALSEGVST